MPDLKTELNKVINQWNSHEESTMQTTQPEQPTTHHNVTTNVTRATFEHIRDNPGTTRATATEVLSSQGFNPSSVSSLIGQMISQRLVRTVGNGLFANQQEYTPLKPALSKLVQSKRKAVATPRPKWSPPELLPVPPAPAPSTPAAWDTSDVIDRLNIKQARALYEELKSIFGA